jgi:multidrug efflux pump
MNISETFIRRPVATTLLMIGLFLVGMLGYLQLPVSALPQVDYPTIVVSTLLPGASADTMASAVTTPLERQLGQMPALSQMTSVSSFGSSQITIQFNLDRNIDAAEQDVQAAINAASNLLPRTLPTPPTYSKSNPADTPIITLAISSDTIPLDQVDDAADSILAQKISQVSGVGLVTLNGGQKPAVRVQVDPSALAGLGLGMEDVRTLITLANVNQPKGNIDGPRQDYMISADDQLGKADSYQNILLAYKNGAAIRLKDVAHVIDGVENAQLAGWSGQSRAIILNVQRQPGANVIKVAEGVKKLLPFLRSVIPNGIDIKILTDRTETVRASVDDVQFTLILTIGLVVAVIYVFLRDLRATIIPGVTVPLSLVGTFGVMYLLGYSLDNLSLMSLTISTGFVVDDAIVMIENIARYIEEGDTPFDAAIKGAKQIGFTILSLTVSLIAVLIPLLFMSGVIGRLFREFAVTLATAIGVSAVLSLTLTPMMCAHLLRHDAHQQQGRFFRMSEAFFTGMIKLYDRGLKIVLDHQPTTLAVMLGTMALTVVLAVQIPKGFFPQQDTGLIIGVTEAAPDISFTKMMDRQRAIADVVMQDPDVDNVSSFIGSDGTNATTNSGRLSIQLKPREERKANAQQIIDRLKPLVAKVDGIELYSQAVQDLQMDSRTSRTQYQFTLEDANSEELAQWGPKMLKAIAALPELRDVASDQQAQGLQMALTVDRDTASSLGINLQAVDDVLYDAFGQRQVATTFTQLNLYRVILEVKPEFQQNPDALSQIYVKTVSGDQVPLSVITKMKPTQTPLSIAHQGQFPSVTLSFNTAPGVALGDATAAILATQKQINMPPSVHAEFAGAAQAFADSLSSELPLIIAALLTVYIVLGVLYESYIHPITILSTLPSAGVGALLALIVCKSEFDIIALIGIILLIGIVKKNGIMMVDFALEAERDNGLTPREAIYQACLLRFRPIMMTTLAALLGGLPLALGTGTGSEMRKPLGIAMVGGLIISQMLTLFTTPVIYLYMGRLANLLKRGDKAPAHPTPGAHDAPTPEAQP